MILAKIVDDAASFFGGASAEERDDEVTNIVSEGDIFEVAFALEHMLGDERHTPSENFKIDGIDKQPLLHPDVEEFDETRSALCTTHLKILRHSGIDRDVSEVVFAGGGRVCHAILHHVKDELEGIFAAHSRLIGKLLFAVEGAFHACQDEFFLIAKKLVEGSFRHVYIFSHFVHGDFFDAMLSERLLGTVYDHLSQVELCRSHEFGVSAGDCGNGSISLPTGGGGGTLRWHSV